MAFLEPVPGYDNDDQLRRVVLDLQRAHDPAQQEDNGYERCGTATTPATRGRVRARHLRPPPARPWEDL